MLRGATVTYMIYRDNFLLVTEHHNLVFCVSCIGIFPLINCYLGSFAAVISWNVEYATPRDIFITTDTVFPDPTTVVDIRIR